MHFEGGRKRVRCCDKQSNHEIDVKGQTNPEDGHQSPRQIQMLLKLVMVRIFVTYICLNIFFLCFIGFNFYVRFSIYIWALNCMVFAHHLHRLEQQNIKNRSGNRGSRCKNTSGGEKGLVRALAAANMSFLWFFTCLWTVSRALHCWQKNEMLFLDVWNGIVGKVADMLTMVIFDAFIVSH